MASAIEVRNLRKRFRTVQAVADVSFTVEEGEIFGLIGPNGSGKTTTVECVQGLRRPDAGELRVCGLDPVVDLTRLRKHVGGQLQEAALPEQLRVDEALQLFASFHSRGRSWTQLMDEWGLTRLSHRRFGRLSGGERQRLFVALALVADPKLVVLDEMTTALDPGARRIAWDLISALRERGTTVLLVTHFMDEVQSLCDRVAVMASGRVISTGSPQELIASQRIEGEVRFTGSLGSVQFLHDVPGVRAVESDGRQVLVSGVGPLLARVAHALVDRGFEPIDLHERSLTLEDAYLALTAGVRVEAL